MTSTPRHLRATWQDILEVIASRIDFDAPEDEWYVQIPQGVLIRECEISRETLWRYLSEMRRHDIVRWRAVKIGYGPTGREPNQYQLLVDPRKWRGRWEEWIFGEHVADPAHPGFYGPGYNFDDVEPEVAADVVDILSRLDEPDIEVDAWLAGT